LNPFIKENKVKGLWVDKKYLLNIDELDFEFKDKTLESTIKLLKDPMREDYMEHYTVCSISRFTEEAIAKFSHDKTSVIDQY